MHVLSRYEWIYFACSVTNSMFQFKRTAISVLRKKAQYLNTKKKKNRHCLRTNIIRHPIPPSVGRTHGAPYRGYGYVPLRFGGNVFIYSQYHDNIYIQVYTCANGLDVGIAYICPLQLVRQFKYIYIYTHIVMQLQKLQVVQIHVYIYKVLVIGMNMNVNSNR